MFQPILSAEDGSSTSPGVHILRAGQTIAGGEEVAVEGTRGVGYGVPHVEPGKKAFEHTNLQNEISNQGRKGKM